MLKLPLYSDLPLPPVQLTEGLDRDPNCILCDLHKNTPAGQRCVPADGTPGDILVVGEETSEWDRRLERPMAGQSGKWVRDLLKKIAPDRNVVFANAIGCKPLGTKGEDLDTPAEACRPYLSKILEECKPKLVLLLGPMAGLSFLGRTYQALSVRTGYSWCWTDQDGDGGMLSCPVFLLPEPHKATRNRLIAKAFEADLVEILRDGPWMGPQTDGTYEVVETPADALEALSWLSQAPYVATDVETSGMMFEPDFRIECLAVSGGERTFVFPREVFGIYGVLLELLKILRNLDHATWNGQYDWCSFACDPYFKTGDPKKPSPLNLQSDTRVKRKLITADAVATLAVAAELIGMGGHKEENKAVVERICMELRKIMLATELTPKGKVRKVPPLQYVVSEEVPDVWLQWLKDGYAGEKFAHKFVPKEIEHRYVALDAKTNWHLEGWCNERLAQDEGLLTIWDEVDQPAMWAWCRARFNGFPTDKTAVRLMSDWLKIESAKVLAQIHGYRPGFNPQSSKQKVKLLEELKIKTTRKTDSGALSADKEVLEEIKDQHPIIPMILKYTLYNLIDVNQVGGLVSDIRSDGYVHANFLQAGTETGRCSSSDPNFFNRLKGRDEESRVLGNMLRACHVAPPGWSFIEADQGQIEVRKAADRCRDNAMITMLNSGADFHMESAKKFAVAQGKDPTKVTDLDREAAKTTNFSAFYEIPSELGFMLSMKLDIPKKLADQLGEGMFKTYIGLRQFMDDSYAATWRTGYSVTYWRGKQARKRPLWNMGKNPETLKLLEEGLVQEKRNRSFGADSKFDKTAARAPYNGDIQGSAVDIITSMIWPVQCWLDANTDGGKFILQIYDSIMLLVKDEDVEKTLDFLIPLMKDELEPRVGYMDGVPLSVDVKVGKSWDSLVKVRKEKK